MEINPQMEIIVALREISFVSIQVFYFICYLFVIFL